MALIIQKYGGSSVGTLDRIHHVASKVKQVKDQGHDVVVVVSAMYGETDRLIQLAHALTPDPDPREYDALVATGEQVSIALLSMALVAKNCPSRSYTGHQLGILTDSVHAKARIIDINTSVIRHNLTQGYIVIVAGFQGGTHQGDITTLGRGGSDTTAVALAAALKADECQIYTDVDGVYTTDPHLIPEAKLLPEISFEEMLEMASLGAKVLQIRSVELACKHHIPLRVLSTFREGPGTLVTFEDKVMQKRLISGIAFNREEALIGLSGIPKQIGIEGNILHALHAENIEIDMITQNAVGKNAMDLTFTIPRKELSKTMKVMDKLAKKYHATVISNSKVAKLSLVGIGIRSHHGITSKMCQTLGNADISIHMLSTSEIKISAMVEESQLDKGVYALHQAFELDKLPTEIQAPLEL